ncbi:MAG: GNAT family N-acetyltransferase [Candidatus Schekmanbacteria bacterium]|nr:GNAT family N-acetyltransferase [Candidatus Schekmanbacteria bacterium]
MSVRYSIAPAQEQHLHALAGIERAAAQLLRAFAPSSVLAETTDDESFRRAVANGNLWVALDHETPVGFALVEMLSESSPHLSEIDVHPAYGRRGLGTALVRAVCEWAADSGYPEVTLTTFRAVPWNMPFYSRLGFEEMPTDTVSPQVNAVVRDETARGLDPRTRVVMSYRTHAPSNGKGGGRPDGAKNTYTDPVRDAATGVP